MTEPLPQHDLDAQKQGSAWITDRGREELAHSEYSVSHALDASIQPLMHIESNLRNLGLTGDELASVAANDLWRSIMGIQCVIGELIDHGR